jgi:hypothetical protein
MHPLSAFRSGGQTGLIARDSAFEITSKKIPLPPW